MNFFQDYSKYNESLNVEETNKKLIDVDEELKKDDVNFNKVLRKMLKVVTKSDILNDHDIKNHISEIYKTLAEKVGKSDKKEEVEKNPKYINLKAFVDAFEKDENENALKIAAQGKEIIAKEEAEKAKKDAEAKTTEPKKEEETSSKMSEEDMKALADKFKKASVTNTSAPLVSLTNNKSEDAIKALQLFLLKNGYYPTSEALDETSPKVDGDIGNQTIAAIKAYQADKGLKADGVVGTQTWKKILTDVKFGIDDAKFKAIKPAGSQGTEEKKEVKKEEAKATDPAAQQKIDEEFKKITGLDIDTKAAVVSIDEIAKLLTNERMSSATVPTDEDKVTTTLLQQMMNKNINEKSYSDLLKKYKEASEENKNGLIADIISAFDTDATKINYMLSEMEPNKAKNSIIYDGIMAVGEVSRAFLSIVTINLVGGSFSDDTKSAVAIFIASRATKNADVVKEMQTAKVNVAAIDKIINYQPATQTAEAKPAEAKPAATTTKTETKQPAPAKPAAKTEAPKIELA